MKRSVCKILNVSLLILLFPLALLYSQGKKVPLPNPMLVEAAQYPTNQYPNINIKNGSVKNNFAPLKTSGGNVFYSPTGLHTIYDIQSINIPQEIWVDPLNPNNVHAVFMYSLVPGFATRYCAYIFSSDAGATWSTPINVPPTGRTGFPSISGFTNGAAVIANHNTANGTPQGTKLYYDHGPGLGEFTELDPRSTSPLAIWPKLVALNNNKIVFSGSVGLYSYRNVITDITPPGNFHGYYQYPGNVAGSDAFAYSPNGIVGHVFIGEPTPSFSQYDAFYNFSTDDGLSWSPAVKIWDWDYDDSLGVSGGVDLVFNNGIPYAAFEIGKYVETDFFPEATSSIGIWSPYINGGIPIVVADSGNVPFYPNKGNVSDGFIPLCRPSIGSTSGNILTVAFSATTGNYSVWDSSSYYSTWVTYSTDRGITWNDPEKITPDLPLRDWRYVSVSKSNDLSSSELKVQMVCQTDSIAGTFVTGGSPRGDAEFIGIRYVVGTSVSPSAPLLLAPPNHSINILLNPLLDWTEIANADTYRVQISNDSDFSKMVINDSTLDISQYSVPSKMLGNDSVYYWRVNAKNSNGTGEWSDVWDFRTITFLPPAPQLIYPANFSTGISLTPTIDWNEVPGVTAYSLNVSIDSNFLTSIIDEINLSVSQFSVPDSILSGFTKYFWRVRSVNKNGIGPWSVMWSFTTLSVPSAPVLVYPTNGLTQVPLTPTLNWDTSANATHYNVQVSTDSNFITTVLNVNNILPSQFTVPSSVLNYSSKYYWRVRAFNEAGAGSWSPIWNFRTVLLPVPSAPSLISPLNGSLNVALSPLLDWGDAASTLSYGLQIGIDLNFDSLVLNMDSILSSQLVVPLTLTTNTLYYWRVNGTNTFGTGEWSTTWNFRTISSVPPAPLLISPANLSTNISLTPTLDWNDVPGISGYSLNVSADSNFKVSIIDQTGLTSSQYAVPPLVLAINSKYFWRVKAINSIGSSEWSVVWSFRTVSNLPSTPVLVSPANFSLNIPLTPTLIWNDVPTATGYSLNVSLDSNFIVNIITQSGLTTSQYSVPPSVLSTNARYYWRVNAVNEIGASQWSEVWRFNTISFSPAPLLIYPANGATGISLTTLLDWDTSSYAVNYDVQVSQDSNFSGFLVNQMYLKETSYEITSSTLLNSRKYFWRTRANNYVGPGPWSIVWSFTTMPHLQPPLLSYPSNGAMNLPLNPLLNWVNVTGATSYRAQVSVDSNFETTVFDLEGIILSQYNLPSILSLNTQYFWRVNATNSLGPGAWSLTRNFRTAVTGVNIISEIIPESFKLFDNYPNPFNPSTKIRFDLPKNSLTKIRIFDMSGRLIQELLNLNIPAGSYEIEFQATDLSSGIYFYRLEANDFVEIKRMVLIK